jgi:hypothetical protein
MRVPIHDCLQAANPAPRNIAVIAASVTASALCLKALPADIGSCVGIAKIPCCRKRIDLVLGM